MLCTTVIDGQLVLTGENNQIVIGSAATITGGIYVGSGMEPFSIQSSTLSTSSNNTVTIASNATIGGDLSVLGNNKVIIHGATSVTGDVIVGNGSDRPELQLNFGNTSVAGDWYLESGKLVNIGDTDALNGVGEIDLSSAIIGPNFVFEDAGGTFDEWTFVDGKLVIGERENVNLSDGFLMALTMHHRYSAWNAVRDRMISGIGHVGLGFQW